MENTRTIEKEDEFGKDGMGIVSRWTAEIELATKDRRKWREKCKKIVRRYRDERGDLEQGRRLNLLWSNTQTLLPVLYAQTPKPEIGRRWKDKDPVGRVAATLLERGTSFCLESYDFDTVMRCAVLDYLLTAQGVAWLNYKPAFAMNGEGEDAYETLTGEKAELEFVHYDDFLTNPARHWGEVRWTAKRTYMTRSQLKKRFGAVGSKVTLDHKPTEIDSRDEHGIAQLFAKATVWEIWDKESGKVIFIATGYKDAPLERTDPSVQYQNFFPCPRPMLGTMGNDSVVPVPDFCQYQDQADEIDDLTSRIANLQRALKVVGVYDSSQTGLQQLLQDGVENQLVPVEGWTEFATKGGMKGTIDWLPLDQVVQAALACYEARERAKADLYEITGISDILRGSSDPGETAAAQNIKSKWGSLRVRDRQMEVQRFARDIIRMKAEMIAERFSPEILLQISGMQIPTQAQVQMQQMMAQGQMGQNQPQAVQTPTIEAVMGLLRNDRLRSFRIDIESDSTIEPDAQEEKQSRIEFVTAVSNLLAQSAPLVQQAPELAPLLGEMLMFAARAFDVGSQLEDVMEQSMQAVGQRLSQPKPDPRVQMEGEKLKMEKEKLQAENQIDKGKLQIDQQKLALEKRSQDIEIGKTVAGMHTDRQQMRERMAETL